MRARNALPSLAHPMGTDNIGRDIFAQVLQGGRVSLAVGVTAMLLALFLGTLIGVLAGYFRRLDGRLMRLTDLFLALPILPLLLVVIMLFRDTLRAAIGPEIGIFLLIVFIIGVTSWMQTARIVRGDVLALKQREFVLAAKSIGTPTGGSSPRHVLPNVLSPIMVSATLGVANAIITESALSFLGPGLPVGLPDLGAAAVRRRQLHDADPGAGDLARPRDLADRALDQLHRRRAARCARSRASAAADRSYTNNLVHLKARLRET